MVPRREHAVKPLHILRLRPVQVARVFISSNMPGQLVPCINVLQRDVTGFHRGVHQSRGLSSTRLCMLHALLQDLQGSVQQACQAPHAAQAAAPQFHAARPTGIQLCLCMPQASTSGILVRTLPLGRPGPARPIAQAAVHHMLQTGTLGALTLFYRWAARPHATAPHPLQASLLQAP